ncbi:MAG: hypothetical protein L6V93_11635 [Clostridiales bacterium]|nr:MAG: hypothetical protein L6V93_11635 [Clostridiales bacterium]
MGAFEAQMDLSIGAIGGKDSMSGTFENIDVPPTLVSFAVTDEDAKNVISPEFKGKGHKVILIKPEYNENNLPDAKSLVETFNKVTALMRKRRSLFGVHAQARPCCRGSYENVLRKRYRL